MDPVRIFIVDDHPIVNRGLSELLRDKSKGTIVVGQAYSGEEAIKRLSETETDIVLLDIRLPDFDGIEVGRRIKAESPETKIIMLTTFNDRDYIAEAIKIGAEGFLLKEASEEMILSTIRAVAEGKIIISTDSEALRSTEVSHGRQSLSSSETINKINRLSQREQEIFMLLAHGKDNREIAETLFISEHTVRNYVSKIYALLDIKNRTAAIIWAQENGIV